MATSTRTDVVLLALHEILIGLAAGLGGALVPVVATACMTPLPDLYESIGYALVAGLLGMIGGVGVVGYRYLRAQARQRNFAQQLQQGLLGIVLGVVVFCGLLVLPTSVAPSNGLLNALAVACPLLGLLIGFNHRIRYE